MTSRSQRDEITTNPATKRFEWSSDNGCFKFYDKENKENVLVDLPFKFMVLQELVTVKGFSDEEGGYWSNEVKSVKDTLNVYCKGGKLASGNWDHIKSKLPNAKFCKSVYIAYKEGNELVIGNIQMVGACLGSWFDFKGTLDRGEIFNIAVECKEYHSAKKGRNTYNVPAFTKLAVSEATDQKCVELDKELQKYLDSYLSESQQPEKIGEEDQGAEGDSNDSLKEVGKKFDDELEQDDGLPF